MTRCRFCSTRLTGGWRRSGLAAGRVRWRRSVTRRCWRRSTRSGLRRREAWGLDLADLRHNPQVRQFVQYGAVFVRWGKSSNGSPPKRRTVLTVPEMDWVVLVLQQWTGEVRPLFSPGAHPALWVTELRGRLSRRAINEAFVEARDAAGLDPVLDLHCLRHSYITHLIEFGYPSGSRKTRPDTPMRARPQSTRARQTSS